MPPNTDAVVAAKIDLLVLKSTAGAGAVTVTFATLLFAVNSKELVMGTGGDVNENASLLPPTLAVASAPSVAFAANPEPNSDVVDTTVTVAVVTCAVLLLLAGKNKALVALLVVLGGKTPNKEAVVVKGVAVNEKVILLVVVVVDTLLPKMDGVEAETGAV